MISSPLKGITRIVDGVGDAADKASRKFTRWSNETAKLTRDLKKIGEFGKPIAAAGVAGAAGIGFTIKQFADLEEAQNRLKVNTMDAMGVVGADYQKMLNLSSKLGQALPGDTKDMVEMFTAMREQGISAQDILGGMGEAAAKFKVVMDGASYSETAQSVAQLSVAMGVAGKATIKFMDTLQRLKSTSGLTMGDLTETMKYLSPSLKALKLQGLGAGQDVGAVLGMLKKSGLDSSTAGTSLAMALTRSAEVDFRRGRGVVKNLIGPILDKQGIKLNFFDYAGSFKGMRAMIGELEKLKKLSSQDQLLVLTKLFGQEAAKPMGAFISQGVAGFDKMNQKMAAQASMDLKIQKIMGGTNLLWETMTGTAQNFVMTAGAGFSDILKLPDKLKALNDLFGKMNDWAIANPKTAKAISMVVVGVTGLALGVGGLALSLGFAGKLMTPFLTGMSSIFRLGASLIGVFGGIGISLGPALLIIGGIALAGILLYKYWKPISAFFKGVGSGISEALKPLQPVFDELGKALKPVTDQFKKLWGWIKGLLTPVEDVGGAAENMGVKFGKAIGGILKDLIGLPIKMFTAGVNIITSLWQGIMSVASKPVDAIKGIAQKIRNHLPFSPAKEGPLRDLHRVRIVETIAQTIKPGPMARAMQRATAATMMAAAIPGGAAHAGGGVTVHYAPVFHIDGNNGRGVGEDLDRKLRQDMYEFERMLKRVLADQQRRSFC